jgi:hypothetical protein
VGRPEGLKKAITLDVACAADNAPLSCAGRKLPADSKPTTPIPVPMSRVTTPVEGSYVPAVVPAGAAHDNPATSKIAKPKDTLHGAVAISISKTLKIYSRNMFTIKL